MQIYDEKIFGKPIDIIEAFDKNSLKSAFNKIEEYKKKYYLLGYIRYEAKNIFLGQDYNSKEPLLYFEVFNNYKQYTPSKNDNNLAPLVIPKISKKHYTEDISKIKDYIRQGITYEVNYTYPSEIHVDLNSFDLFEMLLQNQRTPYNTYIKNKYEILLSFSPELFFKIKDNKIITKPMKGTIQRARTNEEDEQNIEFLKNDIKNQSENVMIVDLLRNDLSRIAKKGTVNVEKLFEIETHKTVHQMTSTITAELEKNVTLYKIFESIFPCGSITGAPKISTMRVIDELEPFKRDIYCGAIGFISPEEIIFSVPIRILQKKNNEKYYLCHTGGAIVWDSDAIDEWIETETKRKFLYKLPKFNLIETMKVQNGKILFFKEHLERLKNSANFFNYEFDESLYDLKSVQDGIMRLVLQQNGQYDIEYKKLKENKTTKIKFSDKILNSSNLFLYHKTDYRPWYQDTMNKIKNGELYDEVYFNEKGELTEGGRSNIVIKKDGELYTPPISSGLLNGVYRQSILDKLKEKILYKNDVINADKIYCINSVRGIVEVKLC